MAENTVIGAGRLYVATLDADDSPGPERYLGDSTGASLTGGEGERLQVFAGDGADSSRKLVDKLLDVSRSMSLTLRDISLENIALFVMGEKKSARTVTKVTDEPYPACKVGDEFQVGVYKDGNAGGFPALTAPTGSSDGITAKAKATASASTYANAIAATSIRVQAEQADDSSTKTDGAGGSNPSTPVLVVYLDTGRVEVATNAVQHGFQLTYTPGSKAATEYVESATEPLEGAVRYVEYDPRNGRGRNVYITKATIRPNGEWPLKSRTNEQTLGLTCEVLDKVYIDEGVDA